MSFSLMPPHCIASLLADAKFASQKHALFVNGISGPGHPRFVTHIDPSCVNDYPQMQVVVDLHGAMVSVRLPIDERIPIDQMLVLKAITRGWDQKELCMCRAATSTQAFVVHSSEAALRRTRLAVVVGPSPP